jgi:hypothetical protein
MAAEPIPVKLQIIKDMVCDIVTARTDEMDCPECFEHMDGFADLLLNGADPMEVMPRLQNHLEHCRHCSEEFEALLNALRGLD